MIRLTHNAKGLTLLKRFTLLAFGVGLSALSFSQPIKFSQLPLYMGAADSSAYVPVIINGQNRRVIAADLGRQRTDSIVAVLSSLTNGGQASGVSLYDNVATISAARAYTAYTAGKVLTVRGYGSPTDGATTQWYWDAASFAVDNGLTALRPNALVVENAGRWIRLYQNGRVRAAEAGVLSDGTNMRAQLNTLLSNASVKEVVFDAGDVSIASSLDTASVPAGKKLVFLNGARLTGFGLLSGGTVDCNNLEQCFATTLNVGNLQNAQVSGRWFGMSPDAVYLNNTWTDNAPLLTKAVNAFASGTTGVIYLPGSEKPLGLQGYYRFASTVTLSRTVWLKGESNLKTGLLFQGVAGLVLNASHCRITDMTVKGAFQLQANGYNSSTLHGITVLSGLNVLENVIVSCFDGDGFHNSGDVNGGSNANLNHYTNCEGNNNGRHGIYFQGGDANACTITGFSAIGDARWGVYDASFLGNTHIGGHCASNAQTLPQQRTYIKLPNGNRYICMADNGPSSSVGVIQPEVTPGWSAYWVSTPQFPEANQFYDSIQNYFTGGAYRAEGQNQAGVFLSCYNEDSEPVINNSPSLFLGGFTAMNADGYRGSTSMSMSGMLGSTRFSSLQVSGRSGTAPSIRINSNGWAFGVGGSNDWGFQGDNTRIWSSYRAFGSGPFSLMSPLHGHYFSDFARHIDDSHGRVVFESGMMLRRNLVWGGYSPYGNISISDVAPTAGDWGLGDIVLNSGPNNLVVGWKCTAPSVYSGTVLTTPATFTPFSTNVLPNYTLSTRPASADTGTEIFCTNATAGDGSTGVVQVWNGALWKNIY